MSDDPKKAGQVQMGQADCECGRCFSLTLLDDNGEALATAKLLNEEMQAIVVHTILLGTRMAIDRLDDEQQAREQELH